MRAIALRNKQTRKSLLWVPAIILIIAVVGFVAFIFFEVCPMCVMSKLTGAKGHQHMVQGTVIEVNEDSISIAPVKFDKVHFLGRQVVLSLPTISASGVPEGLTPGEEIVVTYNQNRVTKEDNEIHMEVVFQIKRNR